MGFGRWYGVAFSAWRREMRWQMSDEATSSSRDTGNQECSKPDDAAPRASRRRFKIIVGIAGAGAVIGAAILTFLSYDRVDAHAGRFLELYRSNWTPGLSPTDNQLALLKSNATLAADVQKVGEAIASHLLIALREKDFDKVPFVSLQHDDLAEVSSMLPFDDVHREQVEAAIEMFTASDLTPYEVVLRNNFDQLANDVDWTAFTVKEARFRIPGGIVGKNLPWVIFDLTIYVKSDTTVRRLEVDGMMLTLQGWQAMPNERMLRYD